MISNHMTAPPATIHVLIVDDSAVVREAMRMLLSSDKRFSVETAGDPILASGKMQTRRPDVIVLDLEMPHMDGITFLEQIMHNDPIPVIICSSLAVGGSENAMRALELGALAIVEKPKFGVKDFIEDSRRNIIDSVLGAAQARFSIRSRRLKREEIARSSSKPASAPLRVTTDKVIVIGASTGGTEAIRSILNALPPQTPGMVIVQHMPEGFTAAFAMRLNETSQLEVKEASSGDRVLGGRALIARGNHHVELRRSGGHYIVEVSQGPAVNRHRPSVEVLFQSAARSAGENALGILLTGMGDDGSDGLLALRQAGAYTIAQDEATSVVFGMPKEAIRKGGAVEILPLNRMVQAVTSFTRGQIRLQDS